MNKFYLHLFSLISIISFLVSCSNNVQKSNWKKINENTIFLNLEPGDIIIKEKKATILELFGHSAIMKDERTVLDYPKIGKTSYEIDISYWLEKNRDILILRYKNMNDVFRKKLLENMKKYSDKSYKINFSKHNKNSFYCSQFIWYVYYKTAEELGFILDLDSDQGIFVFPYDFIKSENLYITN